MPLEPGKSPAAFKHNVETEIGHGKPQKQAVAIAYSEKERTEDDMAEGYAPIKGTISSLAELNAANQRYNNQLEGETTFPNTGDDEPEGESLRKTAYQVGSKADRIYRKIEEAENRPDLTEEDKKNIEAAKKSMRINNYAAAVLNLDKVTRKTQDEHEGFAKLERSLAHEKGVNNPRAVAAAIGRQKYGKEGMAAKAAAGRK